MPRRKPTQLRGAVAQDFGISTLPTASASESGFGRGYLIFFAIWFCLVIASFVNAFRPQDDVGRVRAIGLIFIAFGAGFGGGVAYHIVTRKGFPWSIGTTRSGVFDRETTPIAYWFVAIVGLLIPALIIAAGILIRAKAAFIVSQ